MGVEHLQHPVFEQVPVGTGVLDFHGQAHRRAALLDQLQQLAQAQQLLIFGAVFCRHLRGHDPGEVHGLELLEGEGGNQAGGVGGAIHGGVMVAHHFPVHAQMDIALYSVRALVNGLQIGGPGILRVFVRTAAVGEKERIHDSYATRYRP
ncbi:hypothetical protein AAHB37_01010 [Glutamicibacter halophytocola]